jgi:hypothetical protein
VSGARNGKESCRVCDKPGASIQRTQESMGIQNTPGTCRVMATTSAFSSIKFWVIFITN